MRHLVSSIALVGASVLLSSPTASAQCGLDDQLSMGGCCDLIDLVLPAFPPVQLPSQGIRWDACGLAAQECLEISIDPPMPTGICGVFEFEMKIVDCAGVALLEGKGTLDYTRSWWENRPQSVFAPPGELQVWRFLMKAQVTPVGPLPPVFPNSLGTCGGVFYYGHLDYALDCVSGAWENSLTMYHGADRFSHGALSACPSGADPDQSYAIVGPDTPLNPFVPNDFPVSPGALQGQGMRAVNTTLPGVCNNTEPVFGGFYNPVAFGCLTPLILTSLHQASIAIGSTGACGSNFQALNITSPVIPWRRLISTSLGRWSNDQTYPGPEAARADEGLFVYSEGCAPAGTPADFAVFYGVETLGGYPLIPAPFPSVVNSQHFVDLVSNWTAPVTGPISLPLLGSVEPSKYLIYVNPL